jgi:hypothetical protein
MAIQAALHPSGLWITVPLVIDGIQDFVPVLDTGSPVSVISPRMQERLLGRGLLMAAAQPEQYRLSHITADMQPLPDLDVRVIRRLDRLGADGLLGLDFLSQFRRVCFDTHTLLLVLEGT